MKDYTIEHSEFSDKVSVIETNDPAHADVINTPIKQLFGNTIANKKDIEKTSKSIDTRVTKLETNIDEQLKDLKNDVTAKMDSLSGTLTETLTQGIKDMTDKMAKVNSSYETTSLDILAFAQDYKMYGEKSYVHNNKNYLHALYNCLEVSMNDEKLGGETLEFFIKESKVGHAFAAVYGIEHREVLEKLSTLEAVIGSEAAMRALAGSETAMRALVGSDIALKSVCSFEIGSKAIKEKVQPYRNDIVATLNKSNLFAKTSVSCAAYNVGYEKIHQVCENLNSIAIPAKANTNFNPSYVRARYGADSNYIIYNEEPAIINEHNITSGISFRGIFYQGGYDNYYQLMHFDIWTVK